MASSINRYRQWRLLRRAVAVTQALVVFFLFMTPTVREASGETTRASEFRLGEPAAIQTDETSLEPGIPITREMSGADRHAYRIGMNAGQYLRVVVDQQKIDVELRIAAPDGHPLTRIDSPYGFLGAESLSCISETTGDYLIEVIPSSGSAPPGRYVIQAEPMRLPSPADTKRLAAEQSFIAARAAQASAQMQMAIARYKESLADWSAVGDLYWQAKTAYAVAVACRAEGAVAEATQFYRQALAIQESIGDDRGRAFSLNDLGLLVGREGHLAESVELSKKALPLWEKDGDLANQASTLNNLAVALSLMGEVVAAIDAHTQVLAVRQQLHDTSGVAQTLINLGNIYDAQGESQKSLDYYNQALSRLGEIEHPTSADRIKEGVALNNIGYTYAAMADPALALSYYTRALVIRKEQNDKFGEGATLANIGNAYLAMGDAQTALRYYDEAVTKQNSYGKSYTSMYTGDAQATMGNMEMALAQYEGALALFRQMQDRAGEAAALDKIGRINTSQGKLDVADQSYRQALAIWRKVKDPRGEATSLKGLARNELTRNNLLAARQMIEASIDLIEHARTRILVPQLRATYFASVSECYDLQIDVLMRLRRQHPSEGYDRLALYASERSRGRVLLEGLGEDQEIAFRGANPALLKQYQSLKQMLNAKADRQMQLLNFKPNTQQADAIEKEIRDLIVRIEDVEARLRTDSPHYGALVHPQPLEVEGIQKLLDGDTVLLEYALGIQRSYLWVVTSRSVNSFELPGRKEIEARVQHAYQLLTAANQTLKDESVPERFRRIEAAASAYSNEVAELSHVLIGPAFPLPESRRLLIVADGKLNYFPFSALLCPQARGGASERAAVRRGESDAAPLISSYEIATLPSASVLAVLRRELAGRRPAPNAIAIFADPVFDANDQRVAKASGRNSMSAPLAAGRASRASGSTSGNKEMNRDLQRAINDVAAIQSGYGLSRLFFARREANAILTVVGQNRALEALDFDANLATAQSSEMSSYRIIHFATHGVLNSEHPELSGIVLSLVNKEGKPQDGFLRLHQIYNLNLPAELVVLSACQTALGKQTNGEGLIGLTRGFMYAGAARVISSLWKVDDAATAELMKEFYRKMMTENLSPAAALRAAQLAIWSQKRWQSPYYWAAFVLQGEWK